MIFKELVPWVIILTLVLTVLIAIRIKKVDVLCLDGIIAAIGSGLGLFITSINLIYSNNYTITLGPLLTLACLLYLKYRTEILHDDKFNLNVKKETLKSIQIIYWTSLIAALISYYQTAPYFRPLIFFISVSIAVTALGLEIIITTNKKNTQIYWLFSKILLLSLIFRFSAYFISPYPIGSDPWVHADLIEEICRSGTIYVPQNEYYSNYPLMHLFASITAILGNFTVKETMSISGEVLVLSTIFVYLIVKGITNNTNLALFSMLLVNFSDFHIQWSVQVIAMSFGISIYTIIIYLTTIQKRNHGSIYKLLLVLFMFLIIWTHTISSFIMFISLISLYIGKNIFQLIHMSKLKSKDLSISVTSLILFLVILIYHWIDPSYPLFEMITIGLKNSLLEEAEFLGRETISNTGDSWSSILNIVGFLIVIFFGIIGSLCSLSKKYANKTLMSLVFMQVVLFIIFFAFPVAGIRNIVPYRWPAFIYITLILFTSKGLLKFNDIANKNKYAGTIIVLLLVTYSLFMITNSFANVDSPIYGRSQYQELLWKESEMSLFTKINTFYEKDIISDYQTCLRPFQTYLKRDKSVIFLTTSDGNLNQDYMKNKLIIWRKSSLTRPIQVEGYGNPEILLGNSFKLYIDGNFSRIYDTEFAAAYIDT